MKKCVHEYGNRMLALQPARPPQESHLTSLGLRFSVVNILVVKTINVFGTVQGMPLLLEPPSFFPLCLQFPGPPWETGELCFYEGEGRSLPTWLRSWALLLMPAKPALGPAPLIHTHTLLSCPKYIATSERFHTLHSFPPSCPSGVPRKMIPLELACKKRRRRRDGEV